MLKDALLTPAHRRRTLRPFCALSTLCSEPTFSQVVIFPIRALVRPTLTRGTLCISRALLTISFLATRRRRTHFIRLLVCKHALLTDAMCRSALRLVLTCRTFLLEPALFQVVVVPAGADECPALARLTVTVPSAWFTCIFRATLDAFRATAQTVGAFAGTAVLAVFTWTTVWFLGDDLRGRRGCRSCGGRCCCSGGCR